MKCRNDKCEFYDPKSYSGCDEYNMRSIVKCPNYKSDFDLYSEDEENYCDACGNTISDAEGEL